LQTVVLGALGQVTARLAQTLPDCGAASVRFAIDDLLFTAAADALSAVVVTGLGAGGGPLARLPVHFEATVTAAGQAASVAVSRVVGGRVDLALLDAENVGAGG
jgi:hypothetical protein